MNRDKLIENIVKKHTIQIGDDEYGYSHSMIHGDDIPSLINDLKNLPNELKGVSNNELTQEICPDCGSDDVYIGLRYKNRICHACRSEWQIGR